MKKRKKLNVNGKEVAVKDTTYEDLVILYQQYIDEYGKPPTSDVCKTEYNLPHRALINQILEENGLTHEKFINKFGFRNSKKKYKDVEVDDLYGRWLVKKCLGRRRIGTGNNSDEFWLCECTCGSKITREISGNSLKTGNSQSCGCLQLESIENLKGTFRKKSFYNWCIENNHQDFLDRWDYNLNKSKPSEVSYCSQEWFYFLCPKNKHESSKYTLNVVTNPRTKEPLRCKYCYSFAQRFIDARGENALELYWDYDKNKENPWKITGSSTINSVWLKCTDTNYHGSYMLTRDAAIYGSGCPYCNHIKIHPRDSFGQLLIDRYGENAIEEIWDFDKNTVDPFSIAPSTRKYSVWLKCNKHSYHPSTRAYPNDIKNHTGYCHYCAKCLVCKEDSLGYKYPEVFDIWSDKNEKSPYEYFPASNEAVYWKCPDGKHEDYIRVISDSVSQSHFRCPECVRERNKSMLQEKVENYLEDKYKLLTLHEHNCNLVVKNPKTGCRLLYDNEVVDLKLIIEVHGQQHYEVCGFTYMTAKYYNITPEEALSDYQWKDTYKKDYAIKHGYEYLEIPHWTENDESYKQLIDNKINEIRKKVA